MSVSRSLLICLLLVFPAATMAAGLLRFIPRQGTQFNVRDVHITGVSFFGSGCPHNSVTTSISEDKTRLTLGFDAYQTVVGSGVKGFQREKNCDIFVTLNFPLGCTSAVIDTTHHGFVDLQKGVSGSFPASYSISPGSSTGNNPSASTFDTKSWPVPGVYTKTDLMSVAEKINASNQQNVNLAVRNRIFLQASNSTAEGTLTIDDVTISVTDVKGC